MFGGESYLKTGERLLLGGGVDAISSYIVIKDYKLQNIVTLD